jgi:NitT/TauT family transport system ATP-binding protein
VIAFETLGKAFDTESGLIIALQDINFSVGEGEFVALVGPSGCGKTTLLRIIAGLLKPTTGRVFINNSLVEGPQDAVGVVFQRPVLLAWRTALDNVLLPVEIKRKPTSEDRKRAMDSLKLVGLAGFENHYPQQLSGGMQQRVAISRAMIYDPEILLLDEPFGAVDAMTRETLNLEINRLWLNTRKTTVLITHSIAEAVFLATRVVVMGSRPGRVLEIIDIKLPQKRVIGLQGTPEFAALTNDVRRHFFGNRTDFEMGGRNGSDLE